MTVDDMSVRITTREIYDKLLDVSGKVERVLDAIPASEAQHVKAHDIIDKRLENHGDRLRDVEQTQHAQATLPGQVAQLGVTLAKVETEQNRAAWVPALVAGLVPSVIGAVVIANILPKG